jgi:hypothetical protein
VDLNISELELKEPPPMAGAEDLRKSLGRLREMIEAAHESSIDAQKSYELYTLAVEDLLREDVSSGLSRCTEASGEISRAVSTAKASFRGTSIPSARTISYFSKLYGFYAMAFGIVSTALFDILLSSYPNESALGVPLWSVFFAGMGSSIQILIGVLRDILDDGLVTRYRRPWYVVLPLLAAIFGYVAYLLLSSSIFTFDILSQKGYIALICFAIGFTTNWIVRELSSTFDVKVVQI